MGMIEEATEIAGLIKKIGDLDLYRKIVKLEGEIADLTRAKRQGDERISDLERSLQFSSQLEFRNGLYWLPGNTSAPFCTSCWDVKRVAVHVTRLRVLENGSRFRCPHCETGYPPCAAIA